MQRGIKVLLAFVLVDFVGLLAYATAAEGLSGMFAMIGMGPWSWALSADLVIALGVGCGWMIKDAQGRGESAWGYVALTCVLGSPGLLIYLLQRRSSQAQRSEGAWAAAKS